MSRFLRQAGIFALLASLPTAGYAIDSRLEAQLLKLDPRTRMEQACDTEAMMRIKADATAFRPDKVIAYTFRDPTYAKDGMSAPGAVFRSGGEWYHLSFKCQTGPRHVEVKRLDYQIGSKVARANWEKYYLYD